MVLTFFVPIYFDAYYSENENTFLQRIAVTRLLGSHCAIYLKPVL